MRNKRSVTGIIATAMAAGALMTALTVVTPDVYYDMHNPTNRTVDVVDSLTTSDNQIPDVYYDM